MDDERRRSDDKRFERLENSINGVAKDVSAIRDMLITEPEASPLGRSLLNRAKDNHNDIIDLRRDFERFKEEDFQPLWDWWNQTKGAWRFVLGAGVVLGIIGTFFGILAFWGLRA